MNYFSVKSAAGASQALPPLVPYDLLYSIWSQFQYMAEYQQQDAHEFLVALLDGLSMHMQKHHSDNCTVLQHFRPVANAVLTTGVEGCSTASGGGGGDNELSSGTELVKNEDGGVGEESDQDIKYYSTGRFRFHGIINEVNCRFMI